ncbi:MAG: recombinase family protein, partial [Thermoleophilaceae bacterium]
AESQEGWQIARRFSDQMSGATLERPGLHRALAESEAKRFDLLLVYRVDRLSRSVRGLAQILEQLDQAGALFRSATEPFDTATSAGRMMVQMLGVFAEFERATITDRVIAGMERKASLGEWTGGSFPFGYRLDSERRFLVPEPTEAPVAAEVFRRYTERLEGSASIAKWLSERGYRTKRGKPFNVPAVLTILRNRAYVGEVFFRGRHYPAPHEPLVGVALFDRANEALRRRRRARRRRALRLLRLLQPAALRPKACDADRLPARELEEAILAQLERVLAEEDVVREAIADAFTELAAERPRREAELGRVDAELRKTGDALGRYFAAFEAGTMAERDCAGRIAELSRRLGGLEARSEELDVDADEAPEPLTDDEVRALQAQVREVIEIGDPPARKVSFRRWSRRSGSSAARRSTRLSLCPRFDHRQDQRARQDSNLWPSVP